MRHARSSLVALLALASAAACSDSTSPKTLDPVQAAAQAADRFDKLADSLGAAGNTDGADVAQALAALVRTSGRLDNVVVKVGSRSVTHSAITVETLTSSTACDNSTDPAFCREINPPFSQLIVGWSGTNMKESFFASSEKEGVTSVAFDLSGDFPLADVAYFQRDASAGDIDLLSVPAHSWFGETGTVTTAAGSRGAACNLPDTLQPGLAFTCALASFTPSFDVSATSFDGPSSTPLHITMAPQRVDGLSVTVTQAFDVGAFSVARASRQSRQQQRAAAALAVRALLVRAAPAFVGRVRR